MAIEFPNQPSELTVQLLERKSNRIIEDISPLVQFVQFSERWRRAGNGRLSIRAENLSATSTEYLLAGNAAIRIIREWVEVRTGANQTYSDTFAGPVTQANLMDGDFLSQSLDFISVGNEVIVLGNNTGSSRNVTRVSDTASQALIGCREVIVDARYTTTSAERTARGNATLTEMGEFARQVRAGGISTGGFTWVINFADNLIYLNYRHVGCTGVASVDAGNVAAGNYIRTILNDNLIIPTGASNDNLSRRQIDVPAVIGTYDGIGNTLDLPVRWLNLGLTIRQACIAGDVGLRSSINTSNQIEYNVTAVNDRTSGQNNAVIWNRDNADASWNVQVGDKITLEEYVYDDSTSAEIGPVDQLVVGRDVQMRRGSEDVVRLDIGGENITMSDMLRRTSSQAAYA